MSLVYDMRQALQFFKRLTRDANGNILPIAAMGVLAGALIVGSAVDLSRYYLAKQQIQSACDAGVLAGRRSVTTNGFDTESEAAANAYFNTNFSDSIQGTRSTTFKATSNDDGNTVTAQASTVLDTLLMRIFGWDNFIITASCGSSMGVGNADVMLVLDTTGSMVNTLTGGQTRIAALRDAVNNFYKTMAAATGNSNARVRYGFVPFSSTVNVGRLIAAANPDFLVNSRQYQTRVWGADPSYDTAGSWTKYSNKAYTLANCNAALPSSTEFTNVPGNSRQQKTEYSCISSLLTYYIYSRTVIRYSYVYKPFTYDTSKYKTFASAVTRTGEDGANVTSTWAGCVEERGTVAQSTFTYTSAAGITPSGALDLNLDSAPTSDDRTKWAPMWPEVSYVRYNSSNQYTINGSPYGGKTVPYCPAEAQQLREMNKTDFTDVTSKLVPVGGTYLDIGMIWGGRLLSPQGIWKGLVNDEPKNGGEVARHLIFMTDGEMEPNAYIQEAWGIEYFDRRVTNDGTSNDTARHTQRFKATCEAIKDKGIRVWVVAFTSKLSTDLKTCASDNSSYVATNASELNTAFQEIAKQVGELRVIQ